MTGRALFIYPLLLIACISQAATLGTPISKSALPEKAVAIKVITSESVPDNVVADLDIIEPISKVPEVEKPTVNKSFNEVLVKSENSLKDSFILTQQQWSIPKSARSILSMPVLRNAMQRLFQTELQRLVIYYPGGEVGILWASELKAWLVSLGLASGRIELQSGSLKSDELKLVVKQAVLH